MQTPGCENEQVDLQEEASQGKIILGLSVTIGSGHVGPHLPFQLLHKREEEITEDPCTLRQQMRKHSHRRGASMDSFLAPHRDSYEGTHHDMVVAMTPWGTAPGDAGERGGESERAQHPTVGGWGGGSGPVVEWERESGREKEEDSQCPKSADSLMKFKELEGLVKELISEKTSSHQVLPAIQPRSAGPAHNPSPCPTHISPPQQKLKRGERVDKRKYNPFPWLISWSPAARERFTRGWNSTRLLPGQRHGKQTRDKQLAQTQTILSFHLKEVRHSHSSLIIQTHTSEPSAHHPLAVTMNLSMRRPPVYATKVVPWRISTPANTTLCVAPSERNSRGISLHLQR